MATEDSTSTTDRDSDAGVAGNDRGGDWARDAPPAHQHSSNYVVIDGFGQGGSRTMLIAVDTLRRCGLLQVDNAGMGDTNITTTDGTILDVGILDTDETISEEVPAAINDEAFAEQILENVIPRLADLRDHVQQDTYNVLTPVSNGLLTLQSHALSAQMPYHELKRLVEPIRTGLDWSKFDDYFHNQAKMTEATTINRANDALRKSASTQYVGAIDPPQLSMKLDWPGVDAADFESLFGRGVYAPGRCFLYDTDEISELFPKQVPAGADFQTALEGAATYSAWTNAAAFRAEAIE